MAEQPKLLDNELVQKLVGVIEGLLAGQKKLIIESVASAQTRAGSDLRNGLVDYTHTFKVEDVK